MLENLGFKLLILYIFVVGLNTKTTVAILNCLLARQLCFEDPSCSAILEIIPRVCGPEVGEYFLLNIFQTARDLSPYHRDFSSGYFTSHKRNPTILNHSSTFLFSLNKSDGKICEIILFTNLQKPASYFSCVSF